MKVGLTGLLFLLFLGLKLTHQIAWSWLWVTCPLWAGLAVWAAIMGGILIFVAVAELVTGVRR